uniref:Pleckstrin homology domain-containing family J member 1 n=1 Tax=Rhipicephalus pulchellus TaxID=72859 RepID=L7LVR8_RHIPC
MRFNEKEMATLAAGAADKEGRLNHRNLSFREVFKERWFKLKGNLLFYFRLNEHGGVFEKEPVGLFVIECCKVQHEPNVDYAFAFSIGFLDDADRRHLFTCTTQKHCDEWVSCLQQASYEYQRGRLLYMQQKILELTGRDPLADFISRRNGNAPGSVQAIQKAPESNSSAADGKKRTTIWH